MVISCVDVENMHGHPVVHVIKVKYEGGGFGVDVVNITDSSAGGGHHWYDSSWHWNGGGPVVYDTSFGGGVGDWVDSTTTWHHGDGGVIITSITLPHDTVIMRNIATTVCNNDYYRYGYNGKLKDNEWAGLGNSYDYGARMFQPRIARFISEDPLTQEFPMLTPYQYASNNPIKNIDLDGLEGADIKYESPYGVNFIGGNGVDKDAYNEGYNKIVVPAATAVATEFVVGEALAWLGFKFFTRSASAGSTIQTTKTVVKTEGSTVIKSAKASDFVRTETIAGNKSSKAVGDIMKKMKDGEKLDPIKVAEINGKKFVVDGHHRLEAATRLGKQVDYEVIPSGQLGKYGYKSTDEVLHAASESGAQRVKLNNKVVNSEANSAPASTPSNQ